MTLYTVEAHNRARELATARYFGHTLLITIAFALMLSVR